MSTISCIKTKLYNKCSWQFFYLKGNSKKAKWTVRAWGLRGRSEVQPVKLPWWPGSTSQQNWLLGYERWSFPVITLTVFGTIHAGNSERKSGQATQVHIFSLFLLAVSGLCLPKMSGNGLKFRLCSLAWSSAETRMPSKSPEWKKSKKATVDLGTTC